MANINIENLDLNGSDLFKDSESFITELSDDNEQAILGGCYFTGGCGLTQIGDCGNTIGDCGNTINIT